jgi:replicative DNA helicase
MSAKNIEKIPPQNIEAEQSLLGALMLDPEAIFKVVDFLTTKDFYKKAHQDIYDGMITLLNRREAIDVLSVSAHLKEKNLLKEIGGKSYLTSLVNSVPTASHAAHYANIICKKRVLRDLISYGYEISESAYNEEREVDLILDEAEKKIFSIAQGSSRKNFSLIKDTLEGAFERIEYLSTDEGKTRGVPTGFIDLDNILSGLQKSDLVILAARPSMGKSAFASNIARNVAKQNTPVGMFSLEMSVDQIVDRLIADISGINLWKLRTGNLKKSGDNNDFIRIRESFEELSKLPIYIDDSISFNVMQMRTMARRLQAEKGLGLIIVDYLQLIRPRTGTDSMVQQMTEISRELKMLAKELNVPVLALSQLSRAVEQRTPQIPRLADLRESGAIEQDADVVMFIYREDYYRQDTSRRNVADIIIAKHRNGPVGKIELYFDQNTATFRSLDKTH